MFEIFARAIGMVLLFVGIIVMLGYLTLKDEDDDDEA